MAFKIPIGPGLPAPALPTISLERVVSVLPAAISFTLLGAIESLLSAVVADGMTGRRHRSNCERTAPVWRNLRFRNDRKNGDECACRCTSLT
ncbi:MAG: SulP family inorganic anion transporter [Burkholderiaceae bacterium]